MKNPGRTPSTTSLPRAPREEAGSRLGKYMIMMGIRIACFIAMVVVTPYGWYTWLFAAGAIFLPYFAVVIANVGQDARTPVLEAPERALPAAPSVRPTVADAPATVIRISETPRLDPPGSGR